MITINRHEFPPQGWTFRQPQTGWVNPMAMVGFQASVDAIRKHRVANMAITQKHNLSIDAMDIGDELERYTKLRLGIPESAPSFFQPRRSPSSRSGAGVAAGTNKRRYVARTATGVATLADWLGRDGTPVPPEKSDSRALVCTTCPQNKAGDLLSFFTKPVASLIQRQLSERESLKLKTAHDALLNVCDACGCPLKLKVHVPIDIIRKHMKEPEKSQLDPRCWILHEP